MSEHTERHLLAKTMKGAGWVVGWRFSTRLLGLLNTLVLAHLLMPTDFGLVALGIGFVGAIDALSTFGVEEAVIRESDPDRAMFDTAFTMNVVRGVITATLVVLLAYPTAAFFNEARLGVVLFVLGGAVALGGFENIGIVEYRRRFAFDMEFKLLLLPRLAAILASLGAALSGAGYWSLVAGILVNRVLRLLLSYVFSPYRPRLDLSVWRHLLGFSFWTWLIGLVKLVSDRLPNFFIGRMFDARHVGLFSLGDEIAALPVTELVSPLSRACYSAFSVGRHTGHDAAQFYLRVISTVALLTVPAGTGIAILATPIVHLAVGPQWSAVVPVIRVLAGAWIISSVTVVGNSLLNAHALLKPMLKIALAITAVRAILLGIMLSGGSFGNAAPAVALSSCFESCLYLRIMSRQFGVRPIDILRRVWRCATATAIMSGVLLLLQGRWGNSPALAGSIVALFGAVALGATVYTVALLTLWQACGRPQSAESDVLTLLQRMTARWTIGWRPAQ
jgi:O-antigen/teichoic acid export membrane protein